MKIIINLFTRPLRQLTSVQSGLAANADRILHNLFKTFVNTFLFSSWFILGVKTMYKNTKDLNEVHNYSTVKSRSALNNATLNSAFSYTSFPARFPMEGRQGWK